MKVVVVDDEAPARRRLRRMLGAVPDVLVAGEAATAQHALALVEQTRPDLLLLDVHMPGLDGIALAARYAHLPPIVFVTAYGEHAVRAFDLNAVDYLLKPVRPERLAQAIDRARSRSEPTERRVHVTALERGVLHVFDARLVTRFHAESKYTAFRADGAEHLTEEPLSALELRLAPHGFVRVHRAELVRTSAIRALRLREGAWIVDLADGQTALVSRRLAAPLRRDLSRRADR
jgi:DNA-binding LytR/AlgR family response regulator